MALVLKDRVKETSVSTGTGAIALDGAIGAYQTFSTIGNGNTTYYCIAGQTTSEWEVGIGTYNSGTDSISRDTILASSNSNTIVTFSAGTKDVFITYPSEKAIYEEPDGDTLINAGPITILGPGVSGIPTPYGDTLGRFYGNVDSFQQLYLQNQFNGVDSSSDIVAYNNLGDGTNYFVDMGMAGSTYSSMSYPIFSANSAYLYNTGLTTGTGAAGETSELLIGTGTLNSDLVLFTGGVDTTNEAVRISGADQTIEVQKGVTLNETLDVTGAATFGGTVLLDANPTTALQAATKQYVDNQVTAGLHIHEPVRVETTGNLNATYVQGGTTFNITDITSTTTVTTSVNHGLVVNDQIWLTTTAGNGLSINTAYFVFSTPALNQLTLSLTFDGTQITGLTNAAGLTYATRANSGVGATLTNAGTQAALNVDSIALSVADRVMVRLQTNGAENGVYVVTTVGSGATNWVLTRSTDANMVNPGDPNGLGTGDYFFTQEGVINAGDSHVLTTEPNTMIIGYTTLTYTQFSGSVDYVGGTNINVTGQVISLTGTVAPTNGGTGANTVTTGDLLYGSATNTWSKLAVGAAFQSLVVNGSGTNVEWNAVNLSSSNAVTGVLAATLGGTGQTTYAVGDTLYSSATNTIAKLSGNTTTVKQYLSQTGTGSASAAPSWATISAADIGAGTLPATRGGTDNSSYAVGDLLYADTTTTLAKLADVATGNALISGGISTAPAWGKIGLTTHVSGTLGFANGGTSATTQQGAIDALAGAVTSGQYLRGNGTNVVMAAIQAADVPTLNQNTTGTAAGLSVTLAPSSGGTGLTSSGAIGNVLTSDGSVWVSQASAVFPSGGIIIWSGSAASIPSGWLLCDGASGTPDLRDRFIVGAGSTYAVGATGGSANAVLVSHTHTASSSFTGSALATHNHTASFSGTSVTPAGSVSSSFTGTSVTPAGSVSSSFTGTSVTPAGSVSSSFTGSALATHNHTASFSGTSVTPAGSVSSSFTGSALGTHGHTVTDPGHFHNLPGNTSSGSIRQTQIGVNSTAVNATSSSVTTGITVVAASAGTPSGSVSSSFTGTAFTPAGSVTNVAISAGTPAGSVSSSFTGTAFTPAGSVSSSFTGTAFTPAGSVGSTFTGTAFTPAGSVTNTAISAGTPAGSVSTSNSTEGVSATNANLPPYYALCYIMKT